MLKELITGAVAVVFSVLLLCKVVEVVTFLGILGIVYGVIEIVTIIPKKKVETTK